MAQKRDTTSNPGAASATPFKPSAARWTRPFDVTRDDPYGPHSVAVYRQFNEVGALLYVGISDHPKRRFGQHSRDKAWWQQVTHWRVKWFPDRASAEQEEARAIREEVPAYNVLGVPDGEDERDVRAEWLRRLRRRRPSCSDLDELYLAWVRLRSLPASPPPRTAWTSTGIRKVYSEARRRALWPTLRDHDRHVWQLATNNPHVTFELVPLTPSEEPDHDAEFLRGLSGSAVRSRGRAVGLGVYCTRSGEMVEQCACASRHVVDATDEARYGRPIGHPLGARNRKWRPLPTVAA